MSRPHMYEYVRMNIDSNITTLNDVGINEHCEKRVSASRSCYRSQISC